MYALWKLLSKYTLSHLHQNWTLYISTYQKVILEADFPAKGAFHSMETWVLSLLVVCVAPACINVQYSREWEQVVAISNPKDL